MPGTAAVFKGRFAAWRGRAVDCLDQMVVARELVEVVGDVLNEGGEPRDLSDGVVDLCSQVLLEDLLRYTMIVGA